MGAGLTIEGDKKLAKMLANIGVSLGDKGLPAATERAAKRVVENFAADVPRETGALADSPVIRPVTEKNGDRGHEVYIDRDTLVAERRRRGGKIGFDQKRDEPIFYAAVLEFGDDAPLRTALEKTREEFRQATIAELKAETSGAKS